jgi:lipase maturation factor 1
VSAACTCTNGSKTRSSRAPPTQVRTVLWRYRFTDPATKRATGRWWRRVLVGSLAARLVRRGDGRLTLTDPP